MGFKIKIQEQHATNTQTIKSDYMHRFIEKLEKELTGDFNHDMIIVNKWFGKGGKLGATLDRWVPDTEACVNLSISPKRMTMNEMVAITRYLRE